MVLSLPELGKRSGASLAERFESPGLGTVECRLDEGNRTIAKADLERGPAHAESAVGVLAALLLRRYLAGGRPLELVVDCPTNGEHLREAVTLVADAWRDRGYADGGFVDYLGREGRVTFKCALDSYALDR